MNIQNESIVGIEELEVECLVGILPEERSHPQKISIDLKVSPLLPFSALEDHIDQAIDYRILAEIAQKVAIEGKFQLIETMAVEILNVVLARCQVRWASVRIVKHRVVPGAARAIVELSKSVNTLY